MEQHCFSSMSVIFKINTHAAALLNLITTSVQDYYQGKTWCLHDATVRLFQNRCHVESREHETMHRNVKTTVCSTEKNFLTWT